MGWKISKDEGSAGIRSQDGSWKILEKNGSGEVKRIHDKV